MLKFDPVSRDRMFYDTYEYGVCVSMTEAGCLRARSHAQLDQNIVYRNRARSQWRGGRSDETIHGRIRDDLFKMFDALEAVRDKIKLVISYNIIYAYSNDIQVMEQLANLPFVAFNNAVQSIIDKPRDVVLLKDPKFKYRSYFKDKLLDDATCDRLLKFIESRKGIYHVTSTLRRSLTRWQAHYLSRHLFIEYNDPKDITMLSLVAPGLIRKTVSVQAK